VASGCRILDAGIASTPTCGVLVHHFQAAAGLQITASHNPPEWNGLKPFSPAGAVFDQALGEKLLHLLESGDFAWKSWDQLGSIEHLENPSLPHRERIFNLIDADAIRSRKFKVVLDC